MALHFTGETTNTFDLIEPNTYEVKTSLEYKKTNEGNLYINCKFAIREDVEQEFRRRIIFDGIYKNKNTGAFSEQKINGLLAAVNAKESNPRWDFQDYDDLIQYLTDKNIRVDVIIQKADVNYPGSVDKNAVRYLSYKPTEAPETIYGTVTPNGYAMSFSKPEPVVTPQPTATAPVQEDDDLPF